MFPNLIVTEVPFFIKPISSTTLVKVTCKITNSIKINFVNTYMVPSFFK